MTPTFKYDPSTGCVVEQPVKDEADNVIVGSFKFDCTTKEETYTSYIESLRTIPVSNQKEWEGVDRDLVEEVDFVVKENTAHRIIKQDDGWKVFPVIRMTNGRGDSNLLAIINEAVPDIFIGDSILVPYVNGYIDPISVSLRVDKNGIPIRKHGFAIVEEYHFPSIN